MEFFLRKAKNIGVGKIWAGVFQAKGAGKNMGAAAILAMVFSLLIPEYTMGFGTGKVVDIFKHSHTLTGVGCDLKQSHFLA